MLGPTGAVLHRSWAGLNCGCHSLLDTKVPAGDLPWNIPGHQPASQGRAEPAAAAQQLTASPGTAWISGTVQCQLLNWSRCLLSGKVLYLVHGKEESVIHTSWTIPTFSSLPDHPHPPLTHKNKKRKEKSFLVAAGGARDLRKAHGLCTGS